MADRSVSVYLRAQIDDFKRQMDAASKAAKGVGDESEKSADRAATGLGRMVQSADQNRESWDRAGTSLMTFGGITVAAVGATVAAAIQWESAWAGVLKTVDGTPAQLAEVEAGLRGLTRVLPASHTEIAAVAEAAGQLGVQTEQVVAFTKVMIDLGETTNLSSEEAATSLARFMNVMGTSQSDVSRLGSALVGLGNNYATTESEILAMSMRLSGAGRQIDLSEGQVLGLATAMSSVGIEAEAGGTAMSLTMKRIEKAVDEGGSSVETFARIAGMSASDFSTAWKTDAAGALAAFISGLDSAGERGESVNGILRDLGITGIREADALLRLSAAGTLAFDAMTQGVTEYANGTALIEEANKRYETAEAKIQIAKNAIVDAAIEFGGTFLPAVASAAEGVTSFAQAVGNLPAPVQAAATALAGITGAAALLGGGFLVAFPRVIETTRALRDVGIISPGVASGLGRVGGALVRFGAAAGGIAAVTYALAKVAESSYMDDIDQGMGRVAVAIANASNSARVSDLDAIFRNAGGGELIRNVGDLDSALRRTFSRDNAEAFNDWGSSLVNSATGVKGSTEILGDAFGRLDQVLVEMASSGNGEQAAQIADMVAAAAGRYGATADDVATQILPKYQDSLSATDASQILAAGSADDLAGSIEAVDPAAEAAQEALEEWAMSARSAGDSFGGIIAAYQGVIDKNKEIATSTAEATKSTEDSWEDFYDGTTVSIDDWIAKLQEQRSATENWAANYRTALDQIAAEVPATGQSAAAAFVEEMVLAGAEGAAALQAFVNGTPEQRQQLIEAWSGTNAAISEVMGTPPQSVVEPDLESADKAAQEMSARVQEQLAGNPSVAPVEADASAAAQEVLDFKGKAETPVLTPVEADYTDGRSGHAQFLAYVAENKPVMYCDAETGEARVSVEAFEAYVKALDPKATVGANTDPATGVTTAFITWADGSRSEVAVDASDYTARTTVTGFLADTNQRTGTVTIAAGSNPARSELATVLQRVNQATGIFGIGANPATARITLSTVVADVNASSGSVKVSTARSSNWFDAVSGMLASINSQTATIKVRTQNASANAGGGGVGAAQRKATGGPIVGPGTGTSDSVLIAASNGEHMFTDAEVKAAGGHGAIYAIRAAIRQGSLRGYREGGEIGGLPVRLAASFPASSVASAPVVNVPEIDYARLARELGGVLTRNPLQAFVADSDLQKGLRRVDRKGM